MKQIPRHQQIVELVKKQGYVSTDELVERFNVSPQTIRRDLNELADDNKFVAITVVQPSLSVLKTHLTTRVKRLTSMKKMSLQKRW